jgi:hypothetical protein
VDSLDLVKVCLRRWYLFLPLVLIATGAGVGLGRQLKPSYTALGSYAFVYTHPEAVSSTAPDPRNLNPLVGNGNTALLGEAVQASLNDPVLQSALGGNNRGYAPDEAPSDLHYVVNLPQQAASYTIQTWADSAKEASGVVQAVLQAAPKSAKDAQERVGVPELSRYTVFVTAPTQTTELPPQSPVKLLLTMMAVGIAAGAALSLLVDRLLPARKRIRQKVRRIRPTLAPRPDRGEPRDPPADQRHSPAGPGPQPVSNPPAVSSTLAGEARDVAAPRRS